MHLAKNSEASDLNAVQRGNQLEGFHRKRLCEGFFVDENLSLTVYQRVHRQLPDWSLFPPIARPFCLFFSHQLQAFPISEQNSEYVSECRTH